MTKRIRRTESTEQMSTPKRKQSMKNLQIDRNKISLPVALLSTTNTLVYDAPDISSLKSNPSPIMLNTSPTALTHLSGDDSDHSVSRRSRSSSEGSSRDTLTDASSVASSPTSPAPNHLSGYFQQPAGKPAGKQLRKSASTSSMQKAVSKPTEPVPALPKRAVSHSKQAHVQLAQKRSMQNLPLRSSQGSQRSSREQRKSVDMFKATIEEEAHPFGRELEQLNEAVEEFSNVARCAEAEQDLSVMRSRNLATFCAADYLADIQPLFNRRFGIASTAPMAWI
jgi:hypothetical protein